MEINLLLKKCSRIYTWAGDMQKWIRKAEDDLENPYYKSICNLKEQTDALYQFLIGESNQTGADVSAKLREYGQVHRDLVQLKREHQVQSSLIHLGNEFVYVLDNLKEYETSPQKALKLICRGDYTQEMAKILVANVQQNDPKFRNGVNEAQQCVLNISKILGEKLNAECDDVEKALPPLEHEESDKVKEIDAQIDENNSYEMADTSLISEANEVSKSGNGEVWEQIETILNKADAAIINYDNAVNSKQSNEELFQVLDYCTNTLGELNLESRSHSYQQESRGAELATALQIRINEMRQLEENAREVYATDSIERYGTLCEKQGRVLGMDGQLDIQFFNYSVAIVSTFTAQQNRQPFSKDNFDKLKTIVGSMMERAKQMQAE